MNTHFTGEKVRLVAADGDSATDLVMHWQADSEYYRLLDDEPQIPATPKQIRAFLDEKDPGSRGGFFLIRMLGDDKPIGFVAHWRPTPMDTGNHWLAIGIGDREYWGSGYGADALRILTRYGFSHLALHRFTLSVFEYNARAIKAYENAGFKLEGRVRESFQRDGRRWDLLVMGLTREDWLAAQ